MKNTFKSLVFFFCCLFCVSILAASEPPPLTMLRTTANSLISELNRNTGNLKGNDRLLHSIIRRIVLPHFDLNVMSQAVVGKTYWQAADAATKKEFINEFTTYAIRTYAGALESYNGQQVKFYPVRGYDPSQTTVQINSDVLQKDGPAIPLSYRTIKRGSGWIIYDFSVEGVSFVQNYRSQFASTLQSSGLAGVVRDIKARNR